MNWSATALLAFALTCIYAVARCIYLLFYHPLAKFPGPKFAAISNVYYAYIWMGGRYPFEIEKLHRVYGNVVRIAPNELSFSTAQSFNDIYGHSTKNHQNFIKSRFYEHPQPEPGIVAERDPEKHRDTRRLLSHGFSAKALSEQESIMQEYTDMFIAQLKSLGGGKDGLNIKEWFNWLSFDIIGELAFGESFGAVKSAQSHFWIDTIHDGGYLVTLFQIGQRLPLLWPFIWLSLPPGFKEKFDTFLRFSRDQVRSRVARQKTLTRQDFFAALLSDRSENKSEEWLLAQANVLVIAGSDTTATALTSITYFLSTNPEKLARLQQEIRETFSDASQIANKSLQSLPYLSAVIEEGLRIFPPTAFGLPRISPGAIVDGNVVPAGTVVSTSSWTTTHSANYFRDARVFQPERWLPNDHKFYNEKFSGDNKSAARPFSLGPRGCLGVNLAYVELRTTLAKLVWAFDWTMINSKDIDWERDAKFEGFWQLPVPKLRFSPVVR